MFTQHVRRMIVGIGVLLAGITTAQATDFSTWSKKWTIQFNGYNRSETLTNFPALVVLGDSVVGFNYAAFNGTNADLRFTDSQTNELNYEVESWNTNGNSYVWVQVPALSSGATIFAFWGKSGLTTPPAYTTNGNTWTNGTSAVWHMNATNATDSTSYTNHGTANGGVTLNASGKIGNAVHFDGASGYIAVSNATCLALPGDFTLSLWYQGDTTTNSQFQLCKKAAWTQANGYMIGNSSGIFDFYGKSSAFQRCSKALDTNWHYATYVMTNGAVTSYYDSQRLVPTTTYAGGLLSAGTDSLWMGKRESPTYAIGLMDEVRIETVARSSNWVWACYMNMASNSLFETFNFPPGYPIVNTLPASNVTYTSAYLNGSLTSTGGAATAVFVYWGPTDGGNTASAWSNVCVFPAPQNVGNFLTNVASLLATLAPGQYVYRYAASNAISGFIWAGAPAQTLRTGWPWGGNYGDTIHYVSLDGANASPYTNWAGAATQIQWAVNAAAAGERVVVSNGTYNLTNTINITKGITLRSVNGTNFTFINGPFGQNPANTNMSCISISAGTTVLDGLTISNGYAINGGGVLVGANLTANIYNCYIHHNIASNGMGGGICFGGFWTSGTISNCTIVSNTQCGVSGSYNGGGAFAAAYPANINILHCYMAGNSANYGGAMFSVGGSASYLALIDHCVFANNGVNGIYWKAGGSNIIQNCVFSNNTGMGLYYYGGVGTIRDSTIIDTKGAGGVDLNGSCTLLSNCQVIANAGPGVNIGAVAANTFTMANCTIAGNAGRGIVDTAANSKLIKNCLIYANTNSGTGGGVVLQAGPYPGGMINCTIAGNQATTKGGGIYAVGANNYVANCIVYGNVTTGDDLDEIYNDTPANTNNYWYNCAPTNLVMGQGNTTNNPLFVDAGNCNYRLSTHSPCVNTGTNWIWTAPDVDLDLRMRIRYGTVDMGAYEVIYSGTIFTVR